ncbi:MAG: hypothetical protein ACNA77_00020 [Opitutales bacterium]
MKKQPLRQLIPFVILSALICPVMADESPAPAPNIPANAARPLDTEAARMVQIRNHLMGFGDTLVFLVLAEQDAVVRLRIDHTTPDFTTTGSVILFAPETTKEAIDKWVNNQYSDALYRNVPKPVLTSKLPDDGYTMIESKKVGERTGPADNAPYHDYLVKLAVKAHEEAGKYTLKAFEIEAKVYLKISK